MVYKLKFGMTEYTVGTLLHGKFSSIGDKVVGTEDSQNSKSGQKSSFLALFTQ